MSDGYTIGEVLNQLKDDFADITISKIRFLESEGLVSPARTDSGYRKFTDDDVDRLRFVLTAQRDHYLPLKVIREQLDRLDRGELAPEGAGQAESALPTPGSPAATDQEPATDGEGDGQTPDLSAADPNQRLTLQQMCEATGLDAQQVRELRDFGVLGERLDDAGTFDGSDLAAAKAAREMLQLGLEPRHLRMYRQLCDREVALFEQLAAPLLQQRNAEARRQVTTQLQQLATLSGRLQQTLLSRALRTYLHGS